MSKVLFIVNNRKDRSPGQRFRFEQYLSFLEENGFECDFSPLLNERDDKLFYSPGNYFHKVRILLKSYWLRYKNLRNASKYDIIFVFREALYTRSIFFEKRFSKHAKVIFDFDDSIWLQNVSEANKRFAFLKNAAKTKDIIQLSHLIFAGNEYLADYARKYNSNVTIIPTTIDTNEYVRKSVERNSNVVTIGWSGSVTTIQHFSFAIPALKIIKEKYGSAVEIKVIGDGAYINAELEIQGLPWIKSTELDDLSSFDIGIMPLPDDEWAKGKCGLKGLQYMALEIPTIMSPVGVNSDIIQQGKNGYLASSVDEWVNTISLLIDSKDHREEIGRNGRKTVVENFSVDATKAKYLSEFRSLIK